MNRLSSPAHYAWLILHDAMDISFMDYEAGGRIVSGHVCILDVMGMLMVVHMDVRLLTFMHVWGIIFSYVS